MQEITSLQNPLVKESALLKLPKNREKSGLFLIEGGKFLLEALEAGIDAVSIFINKESLDKYSILPSEKIYCVDKKILAKISDTDSPPDILGVFKQFKTNPQIVLNSQNPLIVALENIKDPGNLGTIIRTSAGAGATAIFLTGECADIFNPKVVRSSAGNLWKIPILKFNNIYEIKKFMPKCQIFSTVAEKNETLYYKTDYNKPSIIFFGSESCGLSDEILKNTDFKITIPLSNNVESLNLAVSTGIILYTAFRMKKYE